MRILLTLLLILTAVGLTGLWAAEENTAGPRAIVIGRDGQPVTGSTTGTVPAEGSVAPKSIEELTGAAAHGEPAAVSEPQAPPPAVDWEPIVQAMQLMIDQQKLDDVRMLKALQRFYLSLK